MVCLVVLGGGFLGNGEYIQAAVCPINTGNCDGSADGSCEADLLTDANNCGHCGIVCNGLCRNGSCVEPLGGLVPCGRISDDCSTDWDERADCNLCHLIIMSKEVIDFLVKIATVIAAFFIAVGGILYIFASGNPGKLTLAKKSITLALGGFALVFVGWIMVDTIMVAFGYIDPLDSGGKWHKMNCEVPMRICPAHCGNGIVEGTEKCERTETQADFCKRKLGHVCDQAELDSVAAEWVEMKGSCSWGCDFRCINDLNRDKIGEGCYKPIDGTGNPCQKGKYTCVVDSDTVECVNIFGDSDYAWDPQHQYDGAEVYDYCCNDESPDNNHENLADGMINGVPFQIVRAAVSDLEPGATGLMGITDHADLAAGTWGGNLPGNPAGTGGWAAGTGFRCDNVCKNVGKICVGVGLTNPSIHSCIYIQHDKSSVSGGCNNDGKSVISMSLPANLATTNCDTWFAMFYYSNKNGTGTHWSTGYDKYAYHCEKYDPESFWETYSPAKYNFNDVPVGSEGVCKPNPPDTCQFHGFDLIETACYCL